MDIRFVSGRPAGDHLRYWAWLWKQRQWWFLRPLPVDEFDTLLITGLPGGGKTTFGADLAITYMRRGIRVCSNVMLRDTYTGQECEPVRTWLDVLRVTVEACERKEACMVYLTEIQQMCDARRWAESPSWWSEMMQQRRHMGLGLMADTQHVDQVEKRLRLLLGRLVQVRPSWLRSLWRRWPVFCYRDMDLEVGEDPSKFMNPGRWRRKWQYSHAFHGHSSWELLSGQDFGDLTTPKALKEIEALRDRAMAANKVERLPAFTDTEAVNGFGPDEFYHPDSEDDS
jgi:hypothetical protein